MDLSVVWREFSQKLKQHLGRKIPQQDVDDVLQEIFLALLRHPPPEGVALPPWLWRIVRNHIADYYRQQRKETTGLPGEPIQGEPFEVSEAEVVVASWLRGFAEFLEPKYRSALIMADFQGASMKTIAASLNLTVSGAKSRVQRARRKLAKDLQDCCAFHFDGEGRVSGWQSRLDEIPNSCGC